MKIVSTPLSGSYIIELSGFSDDRGWFVRTFSKDIFEKEIGVSVEWVQSNHSFTKTKGTIRGMHYQKYPHQEIKLVRCIVGEIFDVIVDIRKDSKTYLQWFGTNLSAENKKTLYIPPGFAHGFQTLTDNVELIYQHSAYYMPDFEAGLLYNDIELNIEWPLSLTNISTRDEQHPKIDLNFKAL